MKVAVVGGGIGGLAAVLALRRAGHEVVCFEKEPELSEAGAGIQLGPNASRLLHRLGLADALTDVAVRPARLQTRRWDTGDVLQEQSAHPDVEALFGAPYYTLHRGDLHRVIAAAVPADVVRLGARCTGVVQEEDAVTLEFADHPPHRAHVVVGADGLRSTLRRLLDPEEPRFSGEAALRVLVPAAAVPDLATPPTTRLWMGPRIHLVSYPVCAGTVLNLAGAMPVGGTGSAGVESWTREGSVEEFAAFLRGWDPDVHRILAAAETTLRLPLFDRPPRPRTGHGRLTLLGDAAHPMLPFFAQGAAQAIEDAWVLGRSLSDATPQTAPTALRRYERARRGRTHTIQRRSARNGRLFHLPDGLRQRARDRVMRRAGLSSFQWLYGYDADHALD
ncbi:FAD-dependent monooxygenase [Streptomyces sp. 6N223]|uniref:FAD-dependent monooxygenase n=1 Tax=Streptomyces sp. 6N223 TaxID=3457412 RepID=UPI003FD0EDC6